MAVARLEDTPPWWFQWATAGLDSGLSMPECSRADRERPVPAEIRSRLFLLVEVRESVKHVLIFDAAMTLRYLFSFSLAHTI